MQPERDNPLEVSGPDRARRHIQQPITLFGKPADAALLMGMLAGAVALIPSMQVGGAPIMLSQLFVAPLLLLAPGIAKRSARQMTGGIIFGVLWCAVTVCFVSPFLVLNGREQLPVTVCIVPGLPLATPWYDDLPYGWRTRAMAGFLWFWLWVDMSMILLRRSASPAAEIPRVGESIGWAAATTTVCLGTIPVLLLFPLSWSARLSGTFQWPVCSHVDHALSLLVFFIIFPAKAWMTNALYSYLRDRKNPLHLPEA